MAQKFPLEKGHYFGPRVASRRSHYGARPAEQQSIRAIERALGLDETGRFDTELQEAVSAAQVKAKKPVSGVVDEATWKLLKIGS
jgi:peptidoglycan hydrolase-like protein with peptidoglycan-binding domain